MTASALALLFAVAVASGATASVVGFGIGSLLTPLLAAHLGMAVAVAAVALPHALATALRAWRLRDAVDGAVLRRLGVLSAVGALLGALGYARAGGRALTLALGALLLLTAAATLGGLARRWRPHGLAIWGLGLLSGAFGGLAGNQGGLRAAALGAFDLAPRAFVATATATGLLVDAARTPVYLWRAGAALLPHAAPIAVASVGVLVGTVLGERVLLGLPRERFRVVVGVAVGLLGAWLLWQGAGGA
ncbi:TSUP family transporter [Roseisolibacter sp. H3M3-2]|uniref:TSUP family transporter n=1 Tax=Roseisolibacter sp. H3M3-2 TaxID=3031323 RepID=UPI0023DCE891|nr:TSUP family transporter [Roseisolibacter sp. H3M3-2]MDF1503722.1 TSUP family transporter [Roseisolibacter sp. H3M3-2]